MGIGLRASARLAVLVTVVACCTIGTDGMAVQGAGGDRVPTVSTQNDGKPNGANPVPDNGRTALLLGIALTGLGLLASRYTRW